jgi:hypothetical protein
MGAEVDPVSRMGAQIHPVRVSSPHFDWPAEPSTLCP